jgi:hypothetical protein
MDVPLGHRDAGVSRQPHDCKCVGPCFSKPSEKRVAKAMEDELARKSLLPLPVDDWFTHPAMQVVETGNENRFSRGCFARCRKRLGRCGATDRRRKGECGQAISPYIGLRSAPPPKCASATCNLAQHWPKPIWDNVGREEESFFSSQATYGLISTSIVAGLLIQSSEPPRNATTERLH